MRPRRRRVVLFCIAGVLTAGAAGAVAFWWLGAQDRLEPCPVLVVLNGDHPARANEAARLYHAGLAPEIWLTEDPRSGDDRGDVGTRSNAADLVDAGVPRDAIRVIPGAAIGTGAELIAVAAALRRAALPCAVAVTSPLHGPRVKVLWWSRVGSAPRLIVRHAPHAGQAGWPAALRELGLMVVAPVGLPR
jgi:uncharacterized SAM-binding protein YcdF (DUF218 family)